jgi:hypothetical protein
MSGYPKYEFKPEAITVLLFDGDWAAVVDSSGNVLDQGHHDDLADRTLERLGVTIDYVPGDLRTVAADKMERGHFRPDANLKEFM